MSHICPWWGGYFIDNPLRRLLHNPAKILGPYVQPGMTVMDVGCGMGLFSIAMAKMVGDTGRVIAIDLQQQMLDVLRRKISKRRDAGGHPPNEQPARPLLRLADGLPPLH